MGKRNIINSVQIASGEVSCLTRFFQPLMAGVISLVTNLVFKVLIMRILASIFGRAVASEPQAGQLVKEGAFVDIHLPVSDYRYSKDGTLTVEARGKVHGQAISIVIDLGSEWKEQVVGDAELTIFWGNGHIRRTGQESDAFLALLAKEYGIAGVAKAMAPRTALTMAGLNSDPRDIKTSRATIKVFFEHNGDDNYGEAFINIDLVNKMLEFHDKDPEYHQGIVSSLSLGSS